MFRHLFSLVTIIAGTCFGTGYAVAQIKVAEADSVVKFGDTQLTRYRVGVSLTAKRGAVRDVFACVPVPFACPEQEVTLVEEDFSDTVGAHNYRMLPGNCARQLVVKIPHLPNRAEAHAFLTYEVRTRVILPPGQEDRAKLVIPKKPPRKLKRYLGKSPFIETNQSKIKKTARKIFAELEHPPENDQTDATEPVEPGIEKQSVPESDPVVITDWQRVKALYDYVQDTIQYKAQKDKSALATLRDGHGDCQNISALFVALCRTNKIPARLVWVHEHVYSEFCLADAEGKLHWFPCETSGGSTADGAIGSRAFGEMPVTRVIMQKGDNFKVPEQRKALRYAAEYMIALPAQSGGGKPSHKFIREQL